MEKFKRYLSLIMTFFILLTSIPVFATEQDEKPNDIKNHWAEKQIKWSYDKGYLSGYPDGSFKPQDNMTNAEYISLIIRILNGNKEIRIDDSNKQMWYSKFIAKAIEIGAINKVENFEPGNNVTRDEALRLLAFAYSVKGDVNMLDKFTDKDQVINKEAIAGLLEKSVVSGYPDDTLKPNNPITRAEIASIVYRGEEVAKLTKIDIDKKDDFNIKAIQAKESDRTNKSYSWNYFYNKDNRDDYKQPEENITPDNKTDEKDALLQKLSALLSKEPEVKDSSNYKNADQDKKTAYDSAIDEGKKITKDNTLEEIKEAIKNIEDSQKALRPKSANIKEEATSVINESKKDDKEVDTEEDLDRKLKESRIQVDNLDGDYSIIALEKNLTVKGRVIGNEDVVEVGATIVTVDKETQLDGENIKLNGKEFTIDFSNLKPGSNKVNIYAYLADGTLVEKVIFIETITKELTSNKEAIFIEDSDDANEETLNDITVFNSKSDSDVKYIGVLNGTKTSDSISKTNIDKKPVLFIRVGTYVARQLDSVVTEDNVRSDIDESRSDEFLPNTTYYKTSSVEFEDLIEEDEINLFFSGFDNSYEPEMIFNENLSEELEKFVKDNNLDILEDIDEETNEETNDSPTPLINDELSNENNTILNDSMEDSLFVNGFSMSDEIIPAALATSNKSAEYASRISVSGKPSGRTITLPALFSSKGIIAKGQVENLNKYTWMSLHGGVAKGTNISTLKKDEADKFAKSMIDDLWNMFFEDQTISKNASCEGAIRSSVGVNADIPLIDKDNKNAKANLTCDAIYNAIIQSSIKMNMQYSKKGLEIFDLISSFKATNESDINIELNADANLSAILKEFVVNKDKAVKKNKKVSNKYTLLNKTNSDNHKFYFASVIVSPMNTTNARVVFSDGRSVKVSDLIALTFDLYFTSEGKLKIEFNDKRKSTASLNGRVALFNNNLENETVKKIKNKKDKSKIINTSVSNYKVYYSFTDFSDYKSYTSLKGRLDLNNKLAVELSPRIVGKRFLYLDTGLKDDFVAEGEVFYYKESKNNKKTFEDSGVSGKITNTISCFLNLNLENFKIKGKNSFKLINPITIHEFKKEIEKKNPPITFLFDKKTQTLNGCAVDHKYKSKTIVVPEKIDGVPVKHIGDDVFKNNKNIKKIKRKSNNNKKVMYSSNSINTLAHSQFSTLLFSNNQLDYSGEDSQIVYLPDTIESIGKNAFSNCDIDEFDLPISLIKIDEAAFAYNKLKSLTLPTSLKEIGKAAFFENELTQVELNNSIENIGDFAFYNNNIEKINFPDSIKEIGELAFYQNNIKEVKIPKSLLIIKHGVFGKNKIEKVNIGNSIIEIEDGAFSNNNLKRVSIPNSVVKLGKMVFSENQLSDVEYPDSLDYIPEMVFYKNQLTHFNINNNIKIIGMSSFDSNKLTNLTIPNSVEKIGKGAFAHNQLVNLILPKKSIEYGQDAFRDNKLTRVEITGYRYDPLTIFDANVEVIKLP